MSLQQLKLKEQQLKAYERGLEGKAEILTQLFIQRIKSSALCEVSLGNLELWLKQAEAIERSPKHLIKIERILAQARKETVENKDALPTVEISVRDYGAMLRDQQEFNELAFRLIGERQKQEGDSTSNGSPDFLTSFWNGSGL